MKAFHEVRSYDSDYMVWQSSYEDISFLAHWHEELELIRVQSGEVHFGINDDEFIAHEGDLVFVDTGDFHYGDSVSLQNQLNFIVFGKTIISPHYHHSHFAHPLITADKLKEYGLYDLTGRLFDSVQSELSEKQPYYQDIVTSLLREFLYRLKRCHPRMAGGSNSVTHRTETLRDMQQIMSYIDEHYSENITLTSAAEKMNFSESHFSKVFKKLTGINFITYVNAVRIEQAASLLRGSDTKITDIALACGFGNIRSFNRTFKEYTGYTPTQFLKLRDADADHFSYYKRKLDVTEYVQHDSLTVIKNTG